MKQPVIFTDLDGTLLDASTYSFMPALAALRLIRERRIPLVICSSKTRSEIEHWRRELENYDPYISENGGGVFMPSGYFEGVPLPEELETREESGISIISLGAPYRLLRQAVRNLREAGFCLTGFGDMDAAAVMAVTGLDTAMAALAMAREFDEPFLFHGDQDDLLRLEKAVRGMGLCMTRGRFHHLIGGSDKGRAVEIVAGLYRRRFGDLVTIALGDSPNDIPMLQRVDRPVIVEKPGGGHDLNIEAPGLWRVAGIGPYGWNEAVMKLFSADNPDCRSWG